MKNLYFIIFLSISLNVFALQNGALLNTKQKEKFSGVVVIKFGTLLQGTATYLGNGFFLTAAHNLLVAGKNYEGFNLSITSNEKNILNSVPSEDYKIILPPSTESALFDTAFGSQVEIPLPDIMLIQVSKLYVPKLQELVSLKVERYLPSVEEKFFVLGAGGSQSRWWLESHAT